MYFAKKKKKKGFTLIELLVVIAIIGILATIVVVNVNSARTKAQDVAIKGSLDSLRAGAELLYDSVTPNSYATLCTSPDYLKASSTIGAISAAPDCVASSSGYVVYGQLKSNATNYWYVDSKGNSMQRTLSSGTWCQ